MADAARSIHSSANAQGFLPYSALDPSVEEMRHFLTQQGAVGFLEIPGPSGEIPLPPPLVDPSIANTVVELRDFLKDTGATGFLSSLQGDEPAQEHLAELSRKLAGDSGAMGFMTLTFGEPLSPPERSFAWQQPSTEPPQPTIKKISTRFTDSLKRLSSIVSKKPESPSRPDSVHVQESPPSPTPLARFDSLGSIGRALGLSGEGSSPGGTPRSIRHSFLPMARSTRASSAFSDLGLRSSPTDPLRADTTEGSGESSFMAYIQNPSEPLQVLDLQKGLFCTVAADTAGSDTCTHNCDLGLQTVVPDLALCDLQRLVVCRRPMVLGKVLGVGGFGKVIEVQWPTDCDHGPEEEPREGDVRHQLASRKEWVAMKTLDDSSSFKDFSEELLLNAALSHPCVIRLLGFHLQPQPAIFLELARGGDLYVHLFDRHGLKKAVGKLWDAIGSLIPVRDSLQRAAAEAAAAAGEEAVESDPDAPLFEPEKWAFDVRLASHIAQLQQSSFNLSPELKDPLRSFLSGCRQFYEVPTADTANAAKQTMTLLVEKAAAALPPMPLDMVLRIAFDLALALQYMHSCAPPLVHLDLKLLNILLVHPTSQLSAVSPSPFLRLTDFGISQHFRPIPSESMAPLPAGVQLNPRWSAPELLSVASFHPGSDVFSFGLLLTEMFSLQLSFSGLEGPFAEGFIRELLLDGYRPDLPHAMPLPLADLVESCWRENPLQRPSAGELCSDLLVIIKQLAPHVHQVVGHPTYPHSSLL